jgi:valyl-tRNA synthetase
MLRGKKIFYLKKRCHGYRNFCNKLWNTIAFCSVHFSEKDNFDISKIKIDELSFNNKWILSKLNSTIKLALEGLESYNFQIYTSSIYDFWMKELCSVYLEIIKNIMYSTEEKDEKEKQETKKILYTTIETCLRLLHPAMPYITEELWQRLPNTTKNFESIMLSNFPIFHKDWENEKIEKDFDFIYQIIKKIRNIKNNYGLNNKKKPNIILLVHENKNYSELLKSQSNSIKIQSFSGDISISEKDENWKKPDNFISDIIDEHCTLFMNLTGMIDFDTEFKRLNTTKESLSEQILKIKNLKETPNYSKIPQNVREQNEEKLSKLNADLKEVNILIEDLNILKSKE